MHQANVFHAGTTIKDFQLVTNGGRVLAVTGLGENLKEALLTPMMLLSVFDLMECNSGRILGLNLRGIRKSSFSEIAVR